MKKAVISTGSKQYIVSEGDVIEVEKLGDSKKLSLKPLLVIDGETTKIGQPSLDADVNIEVIEPKILADKVTAIRFKSKKRVKKVRGHRQHLSRIKIIKITSVN